MTKPLLITIVGPTAVGKTSIAIDIAQKLSTVILSADSRQFFQETTIGTAKPSAEQLAKVPHHFVDNLSIHDFYSVGEFERDVLAFLEIYFKDNSLAIMAGGSGLYIDSVLKGLDEMPQVPEELRQTIIGEVEERGLQHLVEELERTDPDYYHVVDKSNTQRIIRAIEVGRHTGQPFSAFWQKKLRDRPFDSIVIGITTDREYLYANINQRVEEMISNGLVEEAKHLLPHKDCYALQTVGYKELFDYFEGQYDLTTAIELIKRNTRRYAKRQLTWFRRDHATHWFTNDQTEEILVFLKEEIRKREAAK